MKIPSWIWTHLLSLLCMFISVTGMLGRDGESMPFWWQGLLLLIGTVIGILSLIWSKGEGWEFSQ